MGGGARRARERDGLRSERWAKARSPAPQGCGGCSLGQPALGNSLWRPGKAPSTSPTRLQPPPGFPPPPIPQPFHRAASPLPPRTGPSVLPKALAQLTAGPQTGSRGPKAFGAHLSCRAWTWASRRGHVGGRRCCRSGPRRAGASGKALGGRPRACLTQPALRPCFPCPVATCPLPRVSR